MFLKMISGGFSLQGGKSTIIEKLDDSLGTGYTL